MTFEDYQSNALEFAVYKDKSYPFYALVEEVGEVFGKIAKAKRKGVEVDKPGLKKELGDVLWQLAACCKEVGVTNLDPVHEPDINDLHDLIWNAQNVLSYYLTYQTVYLVNLEIMLGSVKAVCEAYSWTLTEVMVENLYKLRDRKERNVLVGEGDNR